MASPTSRTSSIGRLALILAALAVLVGAATGCNRDPRVAQALREANAERSARGLRNLAWNEELANKAQAWAEHMAETGNLSHSTLTDGVSSGWRYLAENVGSGASIDAIHDGFMRSMSHRANLLNRNYSSVGVGVAEGNGRIWIAEVFQG